MGGVGEEMGGQRGRQVCEEEAQGVSGAAHRCRRRIGAGCESSEAEERGKRLGSGAVNSSLPSVHTASHPRQVPAAERPKCSGHSCVAGKFYLIAAQISINSAWSFPAAAIWKR